jgi:hypothetical protein
MPEHLLEHAQQLIILLLAGHGLALAICNMTETPKDDEFVAKAYRLIEVFAGIVTARAKR